MARLWLTHDKKSDVLSEAGDNAADALLHHGRDKRRRDTGDCLYNLVTVSAEDVAAAVGCAAHRHMGESERAALLRLAGILAAKGLGHAERVTIAW